MNLIMSGPKRVCPRLFNEVDESSGTSFIVLTERGQCFNYDQYKYNKSQVQSLFLPVVETGIQQESVLAKLRPYLEKSCITNEELMERDNIAVYAEVERHNKLASGARKSVQFSQVGSHTNTSEQDCNDTVDTSSGKKKDPKSKKNLQRSENDQISATLKSVQACFGN